MSTSLPPPLPTPPTATVGGCNNQNNNLFAAVDMGTNSFKLLIVRADPSTGCFLTLDRRKEPVLLGHDTTSTSTTNSAIISSASQLRATAALRKFQDILHFHRVPSAHSRLVATSAVREAANQPQFVGSIHETLGLHVDVLSGLEEARLIYLGVLQFHPLHNNTILTIDIGGGSTEFVIGKDGKILYSISLKLGHITLSKRFSEITKMREHIRSMIFASDLVNKVKEYAIDKVIGSSGTIRKIEKAIFNGYARNFGGNVGVFDDYRRDWRFCKEELKELVERLSGEERELGGKVRREGFFKRRSEFIVAGAILMEEIFEGLGIEEMEVSEYALGEGVIAEKLRQAFEGYDLNANARWRSVVRLATRFNNKKRMKSAATCAGIAKEIFEGVRKWNAVCDDNHEQALSLEDKDLEYLEAACLLHNIGLYTGKKGYHKQSYRIIMNGDHLHGYNDEEVKLIALLVRHHRRKFPKCHSVSLEGFSEEENQKFRILCTIIRVSAAVEQCQCGNIQNLKFSYSHEGFELVLSQPRDQTFSSSIVLPLAEEVNSELEKELELFRMVLQKKFSIVFPSETSKSPGRY